MCGDVVVVVLKWCGQVSDNVNCSVMVVIVASSTGDEKSIVGYGALGATQVNINGVELMQE